MSDLKAKFWVDALIRRAQSGLAHAYVVHRGDADAGAVLVKLVLPQRKSCLFVPIRDANGNRIWMKPFGNDADEGLVDADIARRLDRDEDLWVIEIEDRLQRHFLTEPVEEN